MLAATELSADDVALAVNLGLLSFARREVGAWWDARREDSIAHHCPAEHTALAEERPLPHRAAA